MIQREKKKHQNIPTSVEGTEYLSFPSLVKQDASTVLIAFCISFSEATISAG